MERITQHCMTLDGYNVRTIHHDILDGTSLCGCPAHCSIATPEQAVEWKADGDVALLMAHRIWKSGQMAIEAAAN
jgi:hypothetical protein